MFNRFRIKKRSANELAVRNKEIEHQKIIIEEKQKEILDSIQYAQRIQKAQLASEQLLKRNFREYSIFFCPKDIVSGDFYWAIETPNGLYFCVADSTGHGVPGAFMSLLNISYLNEAVVEKQIQEPHKILQYVGLKLTKAMYNEDTGEGGKDGMDCILFRVEKNKQKVSWAAANNPVIIIDENHTLIEINADKIPVGKGEKEHAEFTLQEYSTTNSVTFYAFTDGMPDQFGGPKGKKFKYAKLKELLNTISTLPLGEQKEKIAHAFYSWKGTLEQTDDVCIAGFKV